MKNINMKWLILACFFAQGFLTYSQDIEYIPFKTHADVGPESINLTDDYFVGAINGSGGSNGSGGASYSIPIDIPTGLKGMHPNISINYNSRSNYSGIVGKGWSIGGTSSITRSAKSNFHDGELDGVKFKNTDRFVLDGMKLFPLSGDNGANGTTYKTDVENYALITSVSSASSDFPEKFIVETKEGLIHEYGGIPDAIVLSNNEIPMTWKLKYTRDKFGNYIHYVYEFVNEEHRLKSIFYNGGLHDPHSCLKFRYKERSDKNFAYNTKRFNKNSGMSTFVGRVS